MTETQDQPPVVTYSPAATLLEGQTPLKWAAAIVVSHDGTPMDVQTFGRGWDTREEATKAALRHLIALRTNQPAEKTARLHAAAPIMLRALIKAEPWLGRLIAEGKHEKCVLPDDALRALEAVAAAIELAGRPAAR